jgi:hypothetical protein
VVADAGIDVETFTYIMQQTKQDKNLLKKFNNKLEQKARSSEKQGALP